MPEQSERCKIHILSEEYMDFIFETNRPDFLENIPQEQLCQQSAGFYYNVLYVNRTIAEPLSLERFSYRAIPKCYTLLSTEALDQSGILKVHNYPTLQLKGSGVLIGFIDTGIAYENEIFRNPDGSTRVEAIWDQTVQSGTSPEGFFYGSEYKKVQIDEALKSGNPKAIVPSEDTDGHGTFVASVAAGGEDLEQNFTGAAPLASIAVVKLKPAKKYLKEFYYIDETAACYQENDIMLALRYLDELAERLGLPLVCCMALGTNQGDHNGTSPLASVLNFYSNEANRALIVGGGNEADQRHHYYGKLGYQPETMELRVERGVQGFTMEIWADLPNLISVELLSPAGERIPPVPIRQGNTLVYDFVLERTRVYLSYRLLVERTNAELIFLRFEGPAEGIWRIIVNEVQGGDGIFHSWLPVTEFLSGEVYFLRSNPDTTITEPANAFWVTTVASYNAVDNSIAINSGRGYTRSGTIKPDFAAPGVLITGMTLRGRLVEHTGSGLAAAITAGGAALLIEWLVYQLGVRGLDSVQIRNLMILGTERNPAVLYPNREWGYGTLDIFNVLNELRRL